MADRLSTIRQVFDERAATYDQGAFHRELAARVADFADLTRVARALDVATGTGLVLRAIENRMPGLDLVGADISPGMLAEADAALPRASWLEADAAALPLEDRSVDLVTCVTALHMIPDTAGTVAEWRRVLRPGGRVVTATFAAGSRQPGPAKYRLFPVDHASFDTVEALERTFRPHGLAVMRHVEWEDGELRMLIAELAADETATTP